MESRLADSADAAAHMATTSMGSSLAVVVSLLALLVLACAIVYAQHLHVPLADVLRKGSPLFWSPFTSSSRAAMQFESSLPFYSLHSHPLNSQAQSASADDHADNAQQQQQQQQSSSKPSSSSLPSPTSTTTSASPDKSISKSASNTLSSRGTLHSHAHDRPNRRNNPSSSSSSAVDHRKSNAARTTSSPPLPVVSTTPTDAPVCESPHAGSNSKPDTIPVLLRRNSSSKQLFVEAADHPESISMATPLTSSAAPSVTATTAPVTSATTAASDILVDSPIDVAVPIAAPASKNIVHHVGSKKSPLTPSHSPHEALSSDTHGSKEHQHQHQSHQHQQQLQKHDAQTQPAFVDAVSPNAPSAQSRTRRRANSDRRAMWRPKVSASGPEAAVVVPPLSIASVSSSNAGVGVGAGAGAAVALPVHHGYGFSASSSANSLPPSTTNSPRTADELCDPLIALMRRSMVVPDVQMQTYPFLLSYAQHAHAQSQSQSQSQSQGGLMKNHSAVVTSSASPTDSSMVAGKSSMPMQMHLAPRMDELPQSMILSEEGTQEERKRYEAFWHASSSASALHPLHHHHHHHLHHNMSAAGAKHNL